MCGISFFISSKDQTFNLNKSIELIKHRGPDKQDSRLIKQDNKFIGLGHVRLSIIDLKPTGDQPMVSRNGKITMVFNGEIYNFKELKDQLSNQDLKGTSDSEVLLELFAEFGPDCFAKLNGIFSAVFYDSDAKKVFVVRDQLGIKPIYYLKNDDGLFFSSEIRGLKPFMNEDMTVCNDCLFEFLNNGFISEPDTGLIGIRKVPQGSYFEIKDFHILQHKYFNISNIKDSNVIRNKSIEEAIESQLVSDVKLGVFFSGGLDSSVISSAAQKENLFAEYIDSNDIKNKHPNEEKYASEISDSLGLKMTKVKMHTPKSKEEILDSFKHVANQTEELISDFTYQSSEVLSNKASELKFKVMLSGMGGDEVFIGYPRYRVLIHYHFFKLLSYLLKLPFIKSIIKRINGLSKKLQRFESFFSEKSFIFGYSRLIGYFSNDEIKSLLDEKIYKSAKDKMQKKYEAYLCDLDNDSSYLHKALVLDYYGFLSHNLTIADKSSMANSLELRVPLLDIDLYCANLKRKSKKNMKFGNRF